MVQYKAKIFANSDSYEAFFSSFDRVAPKLLDLIPLQIMELAKIRFPKANSEAIEIKVRELSEELGPNYGNYIYYPWTNNSLRILQEPEFIELRTSRNQYKITNTEFEKLRKNSIAIIGQSVGKAISQIIALERICGKIILVDYDVLETSNMNRIMTSLTNINEYKAVITAREIAEFDPYLNIEVHICPLTNENISDIIGDNKNVNLVIEVCDNFQAKIDLRKYCKANQIPVIMDTSDRGMIDIERFDLEPDRPIFHGKLDSFDLNNIDYHDQVTSHNLLASIVDLEQISHRAKLSLSEIGKSIRTWPQLASSVYLGASSTTFIVRKILLEEHMESGRYYIDLEELLNCK